MIACPSCNRRVFDRSDIVSATLDGTLRCRACGRAARLDTLSRWMILCVLSIILPPALLYGNVFYSGHLLLVSMVLIFTAWSMLSYVGFPLFTLEAVPGGPPIDRSQKILMLAVLVVAAIALDGYISSRFEPDEGPGGDARSAHAVRHDR